MPSGIITGHDTEFFVMDKDGRPVPAHKAGFPPKENAIQVTKEVIDYVTDPHGGKTRTTQRYSFYRDGYAVEVNSQPATCRGHVWNYLCEGLGAAKYHAAKQDYKLSMLPFTPVDINELATDPETPDDVKVFGCTPSYNAYTPGDGATQIETSALDVPFRTIATHLHLSFDENIWPEMREACAAGPGAVAPIIKLADFFIGLPSAWFQMGSKEEALEYRRRKLYGKAGEFRIHHHPPLEKTMLRDPKGIMAPVPNTDPMPAIEYRVLSSHMCRHTSLMNFAWGMFRDIVMPAWILGVGGQMTKTFQNDVRRAINTGKGIETLMEEWYRIVKDVGDHMHGGPAVFQDLARAKISRDGLRTLYESAVPKKDQFKKFRDWTHTLSYDVNAEQLGIEGHTGICATLKKVNAPKPMPLRTFATGGEAVTGWL